MANVNIFLDLILIVIGIWMVMTVRGFGGVVGKTLNLITYGAIVTGFAHLLGTLQGKYLPLETPGMSGFVHRSIVLLGFILLAAGFRQMKDLK